MVVTLGMRNAQCQSVTDRDVIDFPAVLRELGARGGLEVRVVVPPTKDLIGDPGERAVQPRRFLPLGWREIAVARREREAVLCAHGLGRDDADGQIELLHHAAHDLELLPVLLPEHRDVRLDQVEELQDDGTYAMEESRARRAFELFGERRRDDPVDLGRRIHFLLLRCEQDVDTQTLQCFEIGFERTRIAVEVLVRPELEPVDEDAGDHRVAVLARDAHELQVPIVQIAHRWHERDFASVGKSCVKLGSGGDDIHRGARYCGSSV